MEVTAEQMVQLKCVLMDCGQAYVIKIGMKLIAGFSVSNCLEKKITSVSDNTRSVLIASYYWR